MRYHRALDGVRALAVSAVLLFHGAPAWLPGGFLGVDAFFVLSGFLITSLLLGEHEESGRIRLPAFWGRRLRRLLPALLLLIATVLVAARWLLPPEELPGLRGDALAALAYLANWRMIYRGGDYFTQTANASPLQHTWSLGIEEQFYLLWPLLVVLVVTRVRRVRPALAAVAGLGAVASTLAAGMLYRPEAVDRAYYGTDTRAAALLVGCLAAAALPVLPIRRAWMVLPALCAVAWAWSSASGNSAWLYHGGFLALAVAVAVVLVHVVREPASIVARILGTGPLAWLGRVSYGVYLWHWPLYAALSGERTGLVGPGLLAIRIATTLAIATASFYLLERPIRRSGRAAWRVLAPAGAAATAGIVALALVFTPASANPATTSANAPLADAPPAGAPLAGRTPDAPLPQGVPSASPTRPDRIPGRPRVAIMGDSVAFTLGEYLPATPAFHLSDLAIQGCGIARLPDIWYQGSAHTNYPGCTTWDARWRSSINTEDPDLVLILLDRWELMERRINGRYQHLGDADYDAYVSGELELALTIASSRGARVALLTAPYTHRSERPDGGLYPEDDPARVDAWNRLLHDVAARHPTHPAVLDLQGVVCPDRKFTWSVNGVQVRSDGLHFTPAGVRQVIAPWLFGQVGALLPPQQ